MLIGLAALVLAAVALTATPARAETTLPPLFDLTSYTDLARSGKSQIVVPKLRLIERGELNYAGSAWYRRKVDVTRDWQTRFTWQVPRNTGEKPPGLAFVIQDQDASAIGD